MPVTLSQELQERIEERVRSGEFQSADAVVEQAVALFLDSDDPAMNADEFLATKAAVEEGLEQASRGEGIDLAEFDRQMRAKHGIPH